jgi:hypothetical protein
MKASFYLAAFGLVQLVLALATDRTATQVDRPIFQRQVAAYVPLRIQWFFTDTSGDQLGARRVRVVLRMASLSFAARSTIVALLLALSGVGFTGSVVLFSNTRPSLWALRLGAAGVAAVVLLRSFWTLGFAIGRKQLAPNPEVASTGGRIAPLKSYAGRLRRLDLLTRYLTVAFWANVIVILIGIGL